MAFTYFFRDLQCLSQAVEHLVPLVAGRLTVRVWDAGCAMGPEVYTLAILLAERMGRFSFRNLRIQATDIDEGGNFGQRIAEGVYSWADVERVPAELLSRYFRPLEGGRFRVCDELRGRVSFQRHDLTSLRPVGSEFCLVVCKNVLLHFDAPMRARVVAMFHASLQAGGLIVMEHTQKLPAEAARRFERVAPDAELYRRL